LQKKKYSLVLKYNKYLLCQLEYNKYLLEYMHYIACCILIRVGLVLVVEKYSQKTSPKNHSYQLNLVNFIGAY
jgi:putative Mn2+ efflux pump MntP